MRALKLPKFSGSSVKPFLLKSSLVMWERRGKLGGKLIKRIMYTFVVHIDLDLAHLVKRLCDKFTVITF